MKTLTEAAAIARKKARAKGEGCSACEAGDVPFRGLHRGDHRCRNASTCTICHGADMEIGDVCAACGRKKVEEGP